MSNPENWSPRDVRKSIEEGNIHALHHAGFMSYDDADYLSDFVQTYEKEYNEKPDPFKNSDEISDVELKYRQMLERATTRDLNKVISTGNVSKAAYYSGYMEQEKQTFAWDVIQDLFKPNDRHTMLNLMLFAPMPPAGPTGVGKTDFAYTVLQGGKLAYPEMKIASNNTTDQFKNIEKWSELTKWIKQTDGSKAFLFDEAAQVLQYADMQAGKALSKLIKLLRKYNCHLIVVGHTAADIPRDIRRQVLMCQKQDKKTAKIGVGIEEKDGHGYEIADVMHAIDQIPQTKFDYDSINDEGSFEFDMDAVDDGEQEQEKKPSKCPVITDSGDRCHSQVKHKSGVCYNHREYLDADEIRTRIPNLDENDDVDLSEL